MPFDVHDLPLLSALAHLFDHEEDLPDGPVARLRHVGWVFAQKWYKSGDSKAHTLESELFQACCGDRSRLAWVTTRFTFFRTGQLDNSPRRGWFLNVAVHVDSRLKNCKFTYIYHSLATNKKHFMDLSIRIGFHEFACFELKGQTFYWHSYDGYNTIVSENDCVTEVHCVAIRAAAMTYARYNLIPAATSLIHHLFTTSHESWVSTKRFGEDPTFQHKPHINHSMVHNQVYYNPADDAVLEHNEGTNATHNRLTKLAYDLRLITKRAHASTWTELRHLSVQLSRQRRSRFLRIARTLLIHRAQAREEARARDPVRKCAACAIEAVKSQLALGLGHKRQRVS